METLATADGQAIDLDSVEQEFAAAMAAPRSDEPEAPAPPKHEPVDPEAPYGRKLDGTPKKAPGGRPAKPRMIEAAPPAAKGGGKAQQPAQDYTGPLTEFTDALWMVMAATPIPNDSLRVRTRVQAHVLKSNQQGVVSAVNTMAQHNGAIRAGVEKLTMGSAGWVLPAVMALAPFAVQTAAIWRAPVEGDMRAAAEHVEQQWAQTFAAMQAEFTQAPEEPPADAQAA